MTAIAAGDLTFKDATHGDGQKEIWIETATSADTGNTIAVTLSEYGIKTVLGVLGWTHTTADSVIVTEAPTTSVSAGVLTITVGGSAADDQKRLYHVIGK